MCTHFPAIFDCSFEWGLRTPNLGEKEAVGGRGWTMVPFERALVNSYRPSIHSNISSIFYAFQRYCRFCSPACHFFHTPPLVFSKFPHVSLKVRDTKSEGVGLIVCAISFQDFKTMWSQSTNVTDRRTTCDRKTTLCTKVHCAVKMVQDRTKVELACDH